jgi:hypothetical protein
MARAMHQDCDRRLDPEIVAVHQQFVFRTGPGIQHAGAGDIGLGTR